MEVEGLGNSHEDEKKSSFDPSDLVSRIAEAVKPKQEGPNFMELFTLMNNVSEKTRGETERAAEKQQSTIVQMMQQNTQMMLAMFQTQAQQQSAAYGAHTFNFHSGTSCSPNN